MDFSSGYLDIIVFAVIAAVLLFRLRAVLGERDENDPPSLKPFTPPPANGVAPMKDITLPQPIFEDQEAGINQMTERWATVPANYDIVESATVHNNLGQFLTVDPQFRPDKFLESARKAFAMVVDAFALGNAKTLEFLLSPGLATSFNAQIADRKSKNESYSAQLNSLKGLITEARLDGTIAKVGVDFTAEQSITYKDAEGRIINNLDGSKHKSIDRWIFQKDLKESNPLWRLVEIIDLPD